MSASENDRSAAALERIAMMLAATFANQMQDVDLPAKAKRLRMLGLSNTEIAGALGTTANSVGVAIHTAHRRGKAKGTKVRRKKK